jgi:hypothetical protein
MLRVLRMNFGVRYFHDVGEEGAKSDCSSSGGMWGRSHSERWAVCKDNGIERPERGRTTYCRIYWRSDQISDHSPIWIQSKTDFNEDFLDQEAPTVS